MIHDLKKPELLAPIGDWAMLQAAIESGCNAIYFGIRGLNMRVRARNFTLRDLPQIAARCHRKQVKAYLALNTIVYENEINEMQRILTKAREAEIDAVICWDFSVIAMAQKIGLEIHLSTQASISNSIALNQYAQFGVSRYVLARECSLSQIRQIKSKTSAEIETFIHGAMCVSESGRCFISQFLYNKSANRGACIQPCRREYRVIDMENEHELQIDNHYIFSPKDLCTIGFIDQLIESRIDSFKIEGRARSPEYVRTVVSCYREAIDAYFDNQLTEGKKAELLARLEQVYHREFSTGFYLGKPINEWTSDANSQAATRKQFVGIVQNYYKKVQVADVLIQAADLKPNDELIIIGPTTGVVENSVTSLQNAKFQAVDFAEKGQVVGIKLPQLVRRNDKVYKKTIKSG